VIGRENSQGSIYDADYMTSELNVRTISVFKMDVDNVSGQDSGVTIEKFRRKLFYNSPIKIIVCDNCVAIIEISEISDRNKIIAENHASAIGGHKGISKICKRIHYNYF